MLFGPHLSNHKQTLIQLFSVKSTPKYVLNALTLLEIVYKISFIFDEIPIFVKSFSVHMSKTIMRAPCGGLNLKIGIKGLVVHHIMMKYFIWEPWRSAQGLRLGSIRMWEEVRTPFWTNFEPNDACEKLFSSLWYCSFCKNY